LETFNLKEYQKKAHETCLPQCFNEDYLSTGLISELGEIAGKLKREIRDGVKFEKEDFSKEIGDVLWYLVELAALRKHLDFNIDFHKHIEIDIDIKYLFTSFFLLNRDCSIYIETVKDPDGVGEVWLSNSIAHLHSICVIIGYSISEVALINNKKLASRKERNKINGAGDER